MKKIVYPARLTVELDVETGKKLDSICEKHGHTRPLAILRAIEIYFARSVRVRERDRAA